ncbi:MAG: hypothetical protein E7019_04240 [Alphaproteobacteria bacterium]|nr:hypothetical protein [Alphaproteobacteria bacterium]
MKKFFVLCLLCLLLQACVMPNYHSQRQSLPLGNIINTQGMSLEQVRGTEITINQKPIDKHQIVFENGEYVLRVDRSSEDKLVAVLDEYGTERKILLRSQITNDKWAQRTGFNGEDISAGYLMVPTNTAINFKDNDFWKFVVCLPFSLVADIINMVILGPSTALINPWYEYVAEVQQ